jgi:hypothetical protein
MDSSYVQKVVIIDKVIQGMREKTGFGVQHQLWAFPSLELGHRI